MELSYIQFAKELMRCSCPLQQIGANLLDYWEPDFPPATVLFSSFGKQLARQYDEMSQDEKRAIFNLVEKGLESDDLVLVAALATGFVEALLMVSTSNEGLWNRIEYDLGERAKHHARGVLSTYPNQQER